MFGKGVKLIGKAGKSLKSGASNLASKVKISSAKEEEEDPTHYSALASSGENPVNGGEEDNKQRLWTKDGAIMVDKKEQYANMNSDRPRETIKAQVVTDNQNILEEAIDDLQIDEGTFDPYSASGQMKLDDDL